MPRKLVSAVLGFCLFASLSSWGGGFKFTTPAEINALKKKPCTLFHVWAVWCGPCIEEMPHLIEFLAKNPKVNPVILDVSAVEEQNQISRQWPILKAAGFTKYMKPRKFSDRKFMTSIHPKWPGSLPYTSLLDKNLTRREWVGSLDFSALSREVQQTCK